MPVAYSTAVHGLQSPSSHPLQFSLTSLTMLITIHGTLYYERCGMLVVVLAVVLVLVVVCSTCRHEVFVIHCTPAM
jgi:hypothetical protein